MDDCAIKLDIPRLEKALAGPRFSVPRGLSRQETVYYLANVKLPSWSLLTTPGRYVRSFETDITKTFDAERVRLCLKK